MVCTSVRHILSPLAQKFECVLIETIILLSTEYYYSLTQFKNIARMARTSTVTVSLCLINPFYTHTPRGNPRMCDTSVNAMKWITLRLLLIAGTNFSEFSGNQQKR